jgi:hypothetical protein
MFSDRGGTGDVGVVDRRGGESGVDGVWRWCIGSFGNGGGGSHWGTSKGSEVRGVIKASPVAALS